MKKFVLLILSGLLAFSIVEIIVSKGFHFPSYGVSYKVRYRRDEGVWTNIRKPKARIFNVEGRTVTQLNNVGLPGQDIVNLDHPIVLLGSSYIEGFQFPPQKIAGTIFENDLRLENPISTVINLGCSGHDPYDSYFRLKYFEKILDFHTSDIILVLNSDNRAWLARHTQPLQFELPKDFGCINTNQREVLQIYIRNLSSFIELITKGIIKHKAEAGPENEEPAFINRELASSNENSPLSFTESLKNCLHVFQSQYEGFITVSLCDDISFNTQIDEFCRKEGIAFFVFPLVMPKYRINGAGHLNEEGNELLGHFLSRSYRAFKAKH